DSMVVHPPVHYLELALLMRAGMSVAYAEVVSTILLSALSLWLICTSRLQIPVKLGLIFGLYSGMTFFIPTYPYFSLHGMRPDSHVAMAWFAGLVALESGRLAAWDTRRLMLGTALLTYASELHYFAVVAFTGVLVYVLWMLLRLRRSAMSRIRLMGVSAMVV